MRQKLWEFVQPSLARTTFKLFARKNVAFYTFLHETGNSLDFYYLK